MTKHTDLHAATGNTFSCKGWVQEAALRMLHNNLDPDVAERPDDLVVYGGIGKAARNWESFDLIVKALQDLEDDETLLIQSGKPVGILPTHKDAPRVIISNSMLVPRWANWETFHELDKNSGELDIDSVNIDQFTVKYYLIDTEILFSRSPFVQN